MNQQAVVRKQRESGVTADSIRELIRYNPANGEFRWLKQRGRCREGMIAGTVMQKGGYRAIQVNGTNWLAHRLAWLLMTGEWPENFIDHINGKPYDNRWANLRAATHTQNTQNKTRAVGKTGLLGVVARPGNRFVAQITIDGRCRYIGSFKSAEEAHVAYLAEKLTRHPHAHIVR